MTKHIPPFSPEIRERAVRLVQEHQGESGSPWAAMQSIAAKIGCSGETLRNWVRQAERDQDQVGNRTREPSFGGAPEPIVTNSVSNASEAPDSAQATSDTNGGLH